jgi:hypothetical protein
MSLSHDGQPLTRRQLRELERQQNEGAQSDDAMPIPSAASRRVVREQGPAEPADEETIVPELVSSDEAVDDAEPAGSSEPIIEVVPLGEPVFVHDAPQDAQPDDTAEHAEIVPNAAPEADEATVVEEMVIDSPAEPAPSGSPSADQGSGPVLAPVFESPHDRTHPSSDELPSSFDDLISLRNTAATNSMSTTSALVLPSVPGSNDVGTALDETGEVIITGSIDLPKSFGSSGAPASGLESNDLDTLLERSEIEQGGSDVAPVSASRAISTNTSSTSLITPPKRARANAPVVLAITAAVLAAGVTGLLLAVFVFQVF